MGNDLIVYICRTMPSITWSVSVILFFSSSVLAILCPWKITQIVQIDRVINTRKQREKSQLKLLRLPKSIEGETTTWQK